jgi:hypothetical protein
MWLRYAAGLVVPAAATQLLVASFSKP